MGNKLQSGRRNFLTVEDYPRINPNGRHTLLNLYKKGKKIRANRKKMAFGWKLVTEKDDFLNRNEAMAWEDVFLPLMCICLGLIVFYIIEEYCRDVDVEDLVTMTFNEHLWRIS